MENALIDEKDELGDDIDADGEVDDTHEEQQALLPVQSSGALEETHSAHPSEAAYAEVDDDDYHWPTLAHADLRSTNISPDVQLSIAREDYIAHEAPHPQDADSYAHHEHAVLSTNDGTGSGNISASSTGSPNAVSVNPKTVLALCKSLHDATFNIGNIAATTVKILELREVRLHLFALPG